MNRSALLMFLVVGSLGAMHSPCSAAEVELRVHARPPALRVEAIPVAPSPGHYWTPGYWGWERGRWAWVGGHWVEARRDEAWVRAAWVQVGDDWVFRPGHWARIVPPKEYVEVVSDSAPPVARVEVVGAPPSADHFWIPGYWRWEGRRHVWEAGRWEISRPGFTWVPAHWIRYEGRWHMRGGHWQAF